MFHSLSHPGKKATVRLISQRFVWHGLRKQVSNWAKECLDCQASKIQNHTKAPIEKITVPEKRFSHIHVDIVGPLPPSGRFTHLFTIIDRTTRWPEAIPIQDTSTSECARALINHWISRFGIPSDITSDRGAQFTSTLWREVAERLGMRLHHTTAYHPQSNGLVERFHRSLKSSLKARLGGPNWLDELGWVLLGLRTAPKEDLEASVAELVYGETLRVPGEFFSHSTSSPNNLDTLRSQVQSFLPKATSNHGRCTSQIHSSLLTSKYVFIRCDSLRKPLQRPYSGPYKVLERKEKTFLVNMSGRSEHISIDRLKPALVDISKPVEPAQAPKRGRPPKIHDNRTNKEPADATDKTSSQEESTTAGWKVSRSGRIVRPPLKF